MTPEERADKILEPGLARQFQAFRRQITEHIRAAVAAEREACLHEADASPSGKPFVDSPEELAYLQGYNDAQRNIAAAIRART